MAEWHWSRWTSLAAALLLGSVSAASYAFGVFSDSLQARLGLTQGELDLLASLGGSGLWVGSVFAGLLGERFGFRALVLVGCALTGSGFGSLYLVRTSWALAAACYFVGELGCSCFGSAVVSVAIRVFPRERSGFAAGISKAFFGISAAFLAQLHATFLRGRPGSAFLLLVAVLLPSVGAFSAAFFGPLVPRGATGMTPSEANIAVEPFTAHLFSTIGLLVLFAALEAAGAAPRLWGAALPALVLAVMLLPAFYGPYRACSTAEKAPEADDLDPIAALAPPSPPPAAAPAREVPLREAARTPEMGILFVAFVAAAACGLTIINNVPSLTRALLRDPSACASDLLVTSIGIGNAIGRAAAGLLSDRLRAAFGIGRHHMLAAVLLCTAADAAALGIGAGGEKLLQVGAVCGAVLYGAAFALVAALAAEVFGAEHFPANYGLLDMAPAVASFAFAAAAVGITYEGEDVRVGGAVVQDYCGGPGCFRGAFLLESACALAASAMVALLLPRCALFRAQRAAAAGQLEEPLLGGGDA